MIFSFDVIFETLSKGELLEISSFWVQLIRNKIIKNYEMNLSLLILMKLFIVFMISVLIETNDLIDSVFSICWH